MSEALPPFPFVGLGGNLGYWQFGALLLGTSRGRVPPQPLCPTQSLSWQDLGGIEPPTAIYQAGPRFRRIVCGSGPETSTPEAGKYLKTRLFKKMFLIPARLGPKALLTDVLVQKGRSRTVLPYANPKKANSKKQGMEKKIGQEKAWNRERPK